MNKSETLSILKSVKKDSGFSFAKNTTYGLGGSASCAYYPVNMRQASAVYNFLTDGNINFVILGNGSNVLASDRFFDGAVICTKYLSGILRIGRNKIFCRAGTKVSTLMTYCKNNGLGGLEFLAGIPASVGGLLYMNGGACGKYIGDSVIKVKLFDGKINDLTNKNCHFGYKYSTMRNINCIILGAELSVTPKSSEKVREDIELILKKRSVQPKGKSCGCVFKNADGMPAGKIIEEAGLKGLTIGCAKVSEEHANFIINSGESSADVAALIKEVKLRVYENSGVLLEEEVVYIGDF